MKLNWLGKAFLGAAALYTVGKVLENSGDNDQFTDEEFKALVHATKANDLASFYKIYRSRRPWADDDFVASEWQMFINKFR